MNKKTEYSPIPFERLLNLYSTIGKLITSSLEISNIIHSIMEQVELFFQPHNWSMLRLEPGSQELYFVIAKGIDPEVVSGFRLKLGEGIAGQVAKTGQSTFIHDAQSDPHFTQKLDNLSGFKTRSIIAVPLLFRNQVLGVIELINTFEDRSFTKEELYILETIADFSAIALNNAMVHERISWMAIHDPLTKLYNFAHLDNYLKKKVTQSLEMGSKKREVDTLYAIVILIDINDFKNVNDTYGHYVGDQVLVKTAALLQAVCRDEDLAVRIGGDEFLIAIMNLHENNIEKTSERIQKQLNQASSDVAPASGFSFGLVTGKISDMLNLIKKADKQMYLQKALVKKTNH